MRVDRSFRGEGLSGVRENWPSRGDRTAEREKAEKALAFCLKILYHENGYSGMSDSYYGI